jgi:hypothetical protein
MEGFLDVRAGSGAPQLPLLVEKLLGALIMRT